MRVVYCPLSADTGIFGPHGIFRDFFRTRAVDDGAESNLGPVGNARRSGYTQRVRDAARRIALGPAVRTRSRIPSWDADLPGEEDMTIPHGLRRSAVPVAAALAATMAMPSFAENVTRERLEHADAEPQNWLTDKQNYSSHNFSRLSQINRGNIGDLKVAWSLSIGTVMDGAPEGLIGTHNMEGPPLVESGIMYITSGNGRVWAIDMTPGNRANIDWVTDTVIDMTAEGSFAPNRGPSLWQDKVYTNLVDGRVVALDRATGEIVWDEQIARTVLGYENMEGGPPAEHFVIGERFTAAPLSVDGKILVGQATGDFGTRGWLAAIDAETGAEIWRTYTIPAPGEPGHETWADDHNAWRTGGGSLWTTGSYDVEQRLTIWGTANPVPMFDPEYRPGDNLWTDSALAFDIDTGEIKWGYQYVPNEGWDYDENGVHMLYDVEINGEMRSVVGHFARNGFHYQLDRTSGDFIAGTQYVLELNWTAGLDPKTGKPVEYDPSKLVQTYAPEHTIKRGMERITACPTAAGGVRWQPPSYNSRTMIAYAAGAEGCSVLGTDGAVPVGAQGGNPEGAGQVFLGMGGEGGGGAWTAGAISAVDVRTNTLVAKQRLALHNYSGAMATAGGLVFTGNHDGTVAAYDDRTLEPVWSFFAGGDFKAPAISFAVNGKQYVAIIAGASNVAPGPAQPRLEKDAQLWIFSL